MKEQHHVQLQVYHFISLQNIIKLFLFGTALVFSYLCLQRIFLRFRLSVN